MKRIGIAFVGLLVALSSGSAAAWTHANSFGGHSAGAVGSGGSHENTFGGSTSAKAGEGVEHTNADGGSSEAQYGHGVEHTNVDGGQTHATDYGAEHTGAYGTTAVSGDTAYHSGYNGTAYAYHPPTPYYGSTAYVYHPPTTVNYYSSSCGNCGGWSTAGAAAAGVVVGAAVATAATSSANATATTNAYNAGVAAGTTNAYSAGYAAGASTTKTVYAVGAIYPTLPAGCTMPNVNGTSYYLCGNNWFLPSYGANGVYYRDVPAP